MSDDETMIIIALIPMVAMGKVGPLSYTLVALEFRAKCADGMKTLSCVVSEFAERRWRPSGHRNNIGQKNVR